MKRIRITGSRTKTIRVTSKRAETIDPKFVAEALGAEIVCRKCEVYFPTGFTDMAGDRLCSDPCPCECHASVA